jgi:alanine racemase
MQSPHVNVQIDLRRVRRNTAGVAARVGVPILAIIKADAYGLGAAEVARAITELVDGWSLFSLEEAVAIDLWRLSGKPAITLGPPATADPRGWLDAHVRPAISTVDQAMSLRDARPVLCVDTGMQRFTCPPERINAVLAAGAGAIDEAFTHATRIEHVRRLKQLVGQKVKRMHAAATALLDEPEARLDAVRPGLALYSGAVRVTTRLAEVHSSTGPIGYTGWSSPTGRHGVIVAGYASGVRPGPVLINGRRQHIPEVGMQSAYVTTDPADKSGDEVVLLGEDGAGQFITESDVATAQDTTPQEALRRLATMGLRQYVP